VSAVPIRELAARAGVWQADVVPLMASFDDDPGARPATLLVTADGFVIFTDILARPSAEVEDLAVELERGFREAARTVRRSPPAGVPMATRFG
jgi:hypothetical protein